MYYKNTETGEYQLAKKKGARYKVWRMFREKWTSDPVNIEDKFPKRVIDTKNYHKLNKYIVLFFILLMMLKKLQVV